MALPLLPVTLPPATRYAGGLYDAATLVPDVDARHLGGVLATDPNAGGHGRWPIPSEGDSPPGVKEGSRPDDVAFPSTIVWAADEEKAVGWSEEEARARAEHVLDLAEQVEVEEHAAEVLNAYPATGFDDFVDEMSDIYLDTYGTNMLRTWMGAVGYLDHALAQNGHLGVIHASRHLLARLEKEGMIIRQGGRMLTPGGNTWAFGAGYSALGNKLVATGPVVVLQSPVNTASAFDQASNVRMIVAERIVTPYWGGPVASVDIIPRNTEN